MRHLLTIRCLTSLVRRHPLSMERVFAAGSPYLSEVYAARSFSAVMTDYALEPPLSQVILKNSSRKFWGGDTACPRAGSKRYASGNAVKAPKKMTPGSMDAGTRANGERRRINKGQRDLTQIKARRGIFYRRLGRKRAAERRGLGKMRASSVISSLAAFFITAPLLFAAPAFIACKAWQEETSEAGEGAEAVVYEAAKKPAAATGAEQKQPPLPRCARKGRPPPDVGHPPALRRRRRFEAHALSQPRGLLRARDKTSHRHEAL